MIPIFKLVAHKTGALIDALRGNIAPLCDDKHSSNLMMLKPLLRGLDKKAAYAKSARLLGDSHQPNGAFRRRCG